MTDGKNPPLDGAVKPKEKSFFPRAKDAAVLTGWIGGFILVSLLLWFLTQPARDRFLQRAVNRVLEQAGDSRRLGNPVASSSSLAGTFFTVIEISAAAEETTGERACIFAFIGEGSFFPCAAMIDSDGKVREFLPLNSHGERIFKRISPGVLKIYIRRIEGAES